MESRASTPANANDGTGAIRVGRIVPGRTRRNLLRALLAAGLLVVVGLFLTGASGPAEARFPINNFTNVDDAATVTPSGQNVAVSGWVKCTEGEIAEVRVTVSQESTGTAAAGQTRVRCLGEETVQRWTVHVATRPGAFDASRPVRVDAWAVPRSQGERTDEPHTWTNDDVRLIER
jgi:hypothetical protein